MASPKAAVGAPIPQETSPSALTAAAPSGAASRCSGRHREGTRIAAPLLETANQKVVGEMQSQAIGKLYSRLLSKHKSRPRQLVNSWYGLIAPAIN